MLLDEWSEFIKTAEIEAGTELGKSLEINLGELGRGRGGKRERERERERERRGDELGARNCCARKAHAGYTARSLLFNINRSNPPTPDSQPRYGREQGQEANEP